MLISDCIICSRESNVAKGKRDNAESGLIDKIEKAAWGMLSNMPMYESICAFSDFSVQYKQKYPDGKEEIKQMRITPQIHSMMIYQKYNSICLKAYESIEQKIKYDFYITRKINQNILSKYQYKSYYGDSMTDVIKTLWESWFPKKEEDEITKEKEKNAKKFANAFINSVYQSALQYTTDSNNASMVTNSDNFFEKYNIKSKDYSIRLKAIMDTVISVVITYNTFNPTEEERKIFYEEFLMFCKKVNPEIVNNKEIMQVFNSVLMDKTSVSNLIRKSLNIDINDLSEKNSTINSVCYYIGNGIICTQHSQYLSEEDRMFKEKYIKTIMPKINHSYIEKFITSYTVEMTKSIDKYLEKINQEMIKNNDPIRKDKMQQKIQSIIKQMKTKHLNFIKEYCKSASNANCNIVVKADEDNGNMINRQIINIAKQDRIKTLESKLSSIIENRFNKIENFLNNRYSSDKPEIVINLDSGFSPQMGL